LLICSGQYFPSTIKLMPIKLPSGFATCSTN
jgi:hypothetical protein